MCNTHGLNILNDRANTTCWWNAYYMIEVI